MFETGFPVCMQRKVHNVLGFVSNDTYYNASGYTNENNNEEYVVEILQDIYQSMKLTDNIMFQTFCEINPYMFRCSYYRMTSY